MLSVNCGLEHTHETIAYQDRVRVEPVSTLRRGFELLEHEFEVKDLPQARPVEQHAVVATQIRRATAAEIAS